MGIVDKKIHGVWAPVDEDEWEADKEAVIKEVMDNRLTMELAGPDTSKEARKLMKDNELVNNEFDPKNFGDELIESPPKAGEK